MKGWGEAGEGGGGGGMGMVGMVVVMMLTNSCPFPSQKAPILSSMTSRV